MSPSKLELMMASLALTHLLEDQPRTLAPVTRYIIEHLDQYDLETAASLCHELDAIPQEIKAEMLPDCRMAIDVLHSLSRQKLMDFVQWKDGGEASPEEVCSKCGASLDDGEGYDGLCGNCADQEEALKETWVLALERVQTRISPNAYLNWFAQTQLVRLTDTTAVVSAMNNFTASILNQHFGRVIQESLRAVTGKNVNVDVDVKSSLNS